jgi:uncharacterized membrane protein YecN with MAPEG domain
MLNTAPAAAALWAGLLLILMVVLSAMVVRKRRGLRIGAGDGGDDAMLRAVRVFGNAAEYIPAGIAAIVLLVVLRGSFYVIHLVGALLFIGRILHAMGLSGSTGVSLGRLAGMVLTYAAYVIAAVSLLMFAFA